MVDAGKAALYIRSILEEIGVDQILPTEILADNRGARQLSNAHQPTRRTRHVDMKHFVILQWTEEERIHYSEVSSNNNFSDSLDKVPAIPEQSVTFSSVFASRFRQNPFLNL